MTHLMLRFITLFCAVVNKIARAANRIEQTHYAKALDKYMHPLGLAGDPLLFPTSNGTSSSIMLILY